MNFLPKEGSVMVEQLSQSPVSFLEDPLRYLRWRADQRMRYARRRELLLRLMETDRTPNPDPTELSQLLLELIEVHDGLGHRDVAARYRTRLGKLRERNRKRREPHLRSVPDAQEEAPDLRVRAG